MKEWSPTVVADAPAEDQEPEAEALEPAPRLVVPDSRRLEAVVDDLRIGRKVTDAAFDAIYPQQIRDLSARHWTPVAVAMRAASLLAQGPDTRVLDVGSGAGKFCLVAALTTPGRFVGVERRGHLVDLARSIKDRYGAEGAEYLHADIAEVDWGSFDAFYFYNPFVENLFGGRERIDSTVDLAPARYERDMALTRERLMEARVGTRVVTYHGPRAGLPWGYELCDFEPCGSDVLELWVKVK